MKNKLTPFFFKISILFLLILLLSITSKATTFTITPTGNKTNSQIRAAINAACGCMSATLSPTDTIRILISGTNTLNVAPDNEIWNLSDYNIVKIDIDGQNSKLVVNKKAEIRLSSNSFLVISPTNVNGFRPINTGNSYLRIGSYDFHGNGSDSFDAVISAGGATSGGATGPPSTPLPIELLYFKVDKLGSSIVIKWATLMEMNNDYFEIERSSDGINFHTISEINGSGSKNQLITYTFSDNSFNLSGVIYYRLKQVDFDGRSETFNIVALKLNSDISSDLLFVYPNPAENFIKVYSTELVKKEFMYEIINLNGNIVSNGMSMWSQPLSITDLNPGVYRLLVDSKESIKVFVK